MIEHRIDRERRLVEVTATGSLTAADLIEYQGRLRADPDFDPGMALLADFSAANGNLLDGAGLRRVASSAPFGPAAPRAILVGDDLTFGLTRMFAAYSEFAMHSEMVRAFRDRESALQWIEAARQGH